MLIKLHFSENDNNSPIIDTLAHREEFRIRTVNYLRQQQITGSVTASSTYEGVPNVVHVSSQLPINHDDSESVKGKSFNKKKNIVS